jgi:hypothetical protein
MTRTIYRFGDQREDGMYFYARRHDRLTGIWLTEEAFRRKNGGKLPALRKGRLRADGKRYYRGAWVSREVFDKVSEGEKVKKLRVGWRRFTETGSREVFTGYTQGAKEHWVPEEAWVARQRADKAAKAARKASQKGLRQPKTCGQFVRPGLIYVGEFLSGAGKRPTRVYFNSAQWKAALEGRDPAPPELRRTRLRAYWWLVERLRRQQ